MGYLKVEAYKDTVAMEESKTLTDPATGITLEGTLPAESVLEITDKTGSGVETAAKRYLSDAQDLKHVLDVLNIAVKVGDQVFTDFEGTLKLSLPLQGHAQGNAYGVLFYDPDTDAFTALPCTVSGERLEVELTALGDLVWIGNDAAASGQNPDDDNQNGNQGGNQGQGDTGNQEDGEPDGDGSIPDTGCTLPTAALLLAGVSGAAAVSLKRKKER